MIKPKNVSGSKSKFAAKFLKDYEGQYPRLAVQFRTSADNQYAPNNLTIEVDLVELDDTASNGFRYISYRGHRDAAQGLQLSGFVDAERPADLYSHLEYHCGGLQLEELKIKTAALTWISNELDKLRDVFGRPESWGASAARFAAVIGAEALVLERTASSRERSGERYRICQIADVQQVVNSTIATFVESRKPVPQQPEQLEPAAL